MSTLGKKFFHRLHGRAIEVRQDAERGASAVEWVAITVIAIAIVAVVYAAVNAYINSQTAQIPG